MDVNQVIRKDGADSSSTESLLLGVVEGTLRDLHGDAPIALRVTPDSSLEGDLSLDSLSRMELLLRIERTFGVDLPEDTLAQAESVRDLSEALRRARSDGAPLAHAPAAKLSTGAAAESGSPTRASTLLQVLDWHVEAHPEQVQIVHLKGNGEQHRITYRELAVGADAIAAGLQRGGLKPRQCVAIMLPTSREYFETYFGIIRAGGIPVPIYPPARASQLEEHVLRQTRILANAQAAAMVAGREAMAVAHLLQARVPGLRQVVTPQQAAQRGGPLEAVEVRADDIAFIQYTSGSTGSPKGVMLTHANLLANIRAIVDSIQATPRDVFISWLPLYHDMGLIGAFLGTLYVGCPLVVMSPLEFLAKPERWIRAIHDFRGTLSAAPNFAYELCLKRVDEASLDNLDLSCLRVAFNGAEPVSADTLLRFQERFARFGLRPDAVMPVYGLAESAVGLSFPPLGRPPRIDRIERATLSEGGRAVPAPADDATALSFVACGRPLAGHEIRIVDLAGQPVGERIEGQLEFRGPSATRGYFHNAKETARLFRDGWVVSGDRAYMADGEIYLTGRLKDIVIRAGRNLYPQEIEQAVGAVDGVRKGGVAAFGSPDPRTGTERLVILAEVRSAGGANRMQLREAVSKAVVEAIGEPADEIVLAPPHTVLKTSSGKVRRSACRALYEQGRVGAKIATARSQVARLALGALWLRGRHVSAEVGRALFSLYAGLIFCVLTSPLWLLTMLTTSQEAAWALGHRAARLYLLLAGIRLSVSGLDELRQHERCVLVCNHASYTDGLLLMAALRRPYGFVVKRELRNQILVGRYLALLGAEFVERFDVKRSVEDANRMVEALARGRSLVVFPEGTFSSRPGLLPFLLGAFLAAARARVPVVPVTIRGSRSILPDGTWRLRRGSIEIEIGTAIAPPAETTELFAAAVRLRDAARAQIASALGTP
jgi:acyl carrier protein